MESETDCLVRYGLMGHVGWFAVAAELVEEGLRRGDVVALRTSRGLELGEILIEPGAKSTGSPNRAGEDSIGRFRALRRADAKDYALRDEARRIRDERFADCLAIIEEEGWPLELIDVEPLLDPTTVLHYLAFDALDIGLIRARFRTARDYDVGFEDLGADPQPATAWRRCGDCDCPEGQCAKLAPKPAPAPASCGDEPAHDGCSSCGVASLLKDRRKPATAGAGNPGEREA